MKYSTLFSLALAAPVFAGTSGKEVIPPPMPPVEPSLAEWFAGGSVGYLTELEEPMYHLHIGRQTGHQIGGWDLAWYLEVGYTDKDESYNGTTTTPPAGVPLSFDLDQLEAFLASNAGIGTWGYDLEIIPVTINAMLQRPLSGNLDAYVGAGLGVSNVDLSVDAGPGNSLSDDDWVFTCQASAGLIYNFTPDFEAYGGARWIYWDDADIGASTLELDDDLLLELGLRFDF